VGGDRPYQLDNALCVRMTALRYDGQCLAQRPTLRSAFGACLIAEFKEQPGPDGHLPPLRHWSGVIRGCERTREPVLQSRANDHGGGRQRAHPPLNENSCQAASVPHRRMAEAACPQSRMVRRAMSSRRATHKDRLTNGGTS